MSHKLKREKLLRLRRIRRILKTATVLLVIVIALVWASDLIVGKVLLSRFSSQCGAEISCDSFAISFKKGRIDARNVAVANPEGFSAHPLMSAESVVLDVQPSTLRQQEVVVEELCINGLNLFYERHPAGKNNFSSFVNQVSRQSTPDRSEETLYRVDKLRIVGIRALMLINDRTNVVKIDDIILDDIGQGKTLTWDELVEYVVTHFSGVFDAENFIVRNPEGFTEKNFIRIDDFHVEMDMRSVPQRRYWINKAGAESLMLNLETLANGRNNMQELAASLTQDQQRAKGMPRTSSVEIDDFAIEHVWLILSNDGISKRVPLGKMSLKNIGKNKPLTAEEVSILLLMQLNNFVNRSGAQVSAALKELMQESAARKKEAADAVEKAVPMLTPAPASLPEKK